MIFMNMVSVESIWYGICQAGCFQTYVICKLRATAHLPWSSWMAAEGLTCGDGLITFI